MKTIILAIISLLFYLPEKDTKPSLEEVRRQFFEMKSESCASLDLFESIRSDTYASATMQAYAGATEAASAECVDGAFTKLEYFSRGKKNIEEAVERETQNPEIRFLRFVTQANLPDFITYDNIRKDKALIIERLPQLLEDDQNKWFWVKVAQFMAASNELSKKEKESIDRMLPKNN